MFGKDFLQGTMDKLESDGIRHPLNEDLVVKGVSNPDDFGMPGRKPMTSPSRMAGVRLGAVGFADAIAGEISDRIIMPLGEKAIGATVNHLADTLRNPQKNQMTANILGTLGGRF
jgi:hypothetical protein